MKEIDYQTRGTCSRRIQILLNDDNTIARVQFQGGCSGNTQGVASLVIGMPASEAIKRLKGIRCGAKSTSCPDQLALALEQAEEE